MSYIGRFAPSPTGPLHFGSLIAATASFLDARKAGGKWLLRIEDIDMQRCKQSHASEIIHTLESFGFEWDGEIVYQSERLGLYQQALATIRTHTYRCSCTRKELTALAGRGKFTYRYPGLCRNKPMNSSRSCMSIRVKTAADPVCFDDRCQGRYCQSIEQEIGDFILRRTDGMYAYQLAVVVDDALQKVTHIVRGADLFDNTPRQLYLQGLLGYPTPAYLHFPVMVSADGKKLSKQNLAPAIHAHDRQKRKQLLIDAMRFLGQTVRSEMRSTSLAEIWRRGINEWDVTRIPKKLKVHYEQQK